MWLIYFSKRALGRICPQLVYLLSNADDWRLHDSSTLHDYDDKCMLYIKLTDLF